MFFQSYDVKCTATFFSVHSVYAVHSSDINHYHKPRFIRVWGISDSDHDLPHIFVKLNGSKYSQRMGDWRHFQLVSSVSDSTNVELPRYAQPTVSSEQVWNWSRCRHSTIITSVRDWQSTLNLDTTWMHTVHHVTNKAIRTTSYYTLFIRWLLLQHHHQITTYIRAT